MFRFNLQIKFFLYPFIIFYTFFGHLPFLEVYSSQEKKEDKRISVEFLKNVPSNDYIIGSGDSLTIIISRELSLSSDVTVDGEGTVYLPKLKRVFIKGLTINELNSLLNKAYKDFIKFPNVETIVTQYRPIRVFVEGEVVNPGLQVLDGSFSTTQISNESSKNLSMFENDSFSSFNEFSNTNNLNYYFPTVFDAIRASGGITQFSNLKNIQIIRRDFLSNGSGKKTTTLNFEDLLRFGENSQNIRIYDSDIIKVKKDSKSNKSLLTKAILSNLNPKFIKVFVSGRVNRPGEVVVSRASVLSDAIDMAGGAKILRGPVTFIRFQSDGSIDKRKLTFTKSKRGKYVNPNLRGGDFIFVGENLLSLSNEVITEFTTPFIGIFSTYGLIKAISE